MITITRRFQFCAGHRVFGHENKCAHLHGHNYVAHVTVSAPELDSLGRVIDFGALKVKMGAWIDDTMDHAFLVFDKDEEAMNALGRINGQRIRRMDSNPTAENIAAMMGKYLQDELQGTGCIIEQVKLHETENCAATWTRR